MAPPGRYARCSGIGVGLQRFVLALLLTALCSPACGGSAEQGAAELRDTTSSWTATLKLATEEWARGAVPSHFVRSTITVASKELRSASRRVRAKTGAAASAPADQVLARVPLLNAAIERGDRSGALDIVRALARAVPPKPTPPVARTQ